MVSKVRSIGLFGLDGYAVETETDLRKSDVTTIDIVGLPDTAIKEATKRVSAALINTKNLSVSFAATVNLAPADVRKEGSHFDLPIILGILAGLKRIPQPDKDTAFLGEISLSGDIRPCRGVLAAVISAKQLGFKKIFVPEGNLAESSLIDGIEVYGANHLSRIINHLNRTDLIPAATRRPFPKQMPGRRAPVRTPARARLRHGTCSHP